MRVVPLFDHASGLEIVHRLRHAADEIEAETDEDNRTVSVAMVFLHQSGEIEVYGWGQTDRYRLLGMLVQATAAQTAGD